MREGSRPTQRRQRRLTALALLALLLPPVAAGLISRHNSRAPADTQIHESLVKYPLSAVSWRRNFPRMSPTPGNTDDRNVLRALKGGNVVSLTGRVDAANGAP